MRVRGVGAPEPRKSGGGGSAGAEAEIRAVIFDLWETLIDWNAAEAAEMVERVAAIACGGFRERWSNSLNRYTGPIRVALTDAGVPPEVLEEVCALRLDYVRRALVPRPGAVETLRVLRERGYRVGLITVCSEDVETLWADSPFAGLFDAEVFSSSLGISKPDPRIYLACCAALGVEPGEAMFVGDGANDELGGARRVGIPAVLIHRAGEDPLWGLETWDGPRVTTIPEVLEVLDRC